MATPQSGARRLQLMIKRVLDVVVCGTLLVLLLPVLVMLALLVRLDSPGPVFFVQERTGRNGRPFRMWKFRSMRQSPTGAKQQLVWTADDAIRVTRLGSFMRDFGFDELPQLWNILKGDMSIIGPRPPLPQQAAEFDEWQRKMFRMRPGVLSLAAVRGRRSILPEQRIAYHVRYVEEWSLSLDWYVLWRSFGVVAGRRDAVDVSVDVPRR